MKSVGVVCSTYRDPDKDTFIRNYGIYSLISQMLHQNYDGQVRIAIIDDSPESHVFANNISNELKNEVLYIHAPSRESLREKLLKLYPNSALFVPSNEVLQKAALCLVSEMDRKGNDIYEADLKLASGNFKYLTDDEWDFVIGRKSSEALSAEEISNFLAGKIIASDAETKFWAARLRETRFFANFVPFEEDYPFQTNIYKQIFGDRPTIGMKKNVGNSILEEKFGAYEAIIYADDDDQHGPDYIRKYVEALDGKDFVRMTRYMTYLASGKPVKSLTGIFELKVQTDGQGYWYLPKTEQDRPMYLSMPDGSIEQKRIGSKFSRPVSVGWPIISHEGALHALSFDVWKKSVELCGGASPVSFCEDIIYYRRLRDCLGASFKDGLVPISQGEEEFIRIADGNNASIIEVTENIKPEDMPLWAQEVISDMQSWRKVSNYEHPKIQERLAEVFLHAYQKAQPPHPNRELQLA